MASGSSRGRLTSGWRKPEAPLRGPAARVMDGRLERRALRKPSGSPGFYPVQTRLTLFFVCLQPRNLTRDVQLSRQSAGGGRECGGEEHGPRTDVHTRGSDASCVVPPAARNAGRAADNRGPRVRWADCDVGRRAVSPLPACNCLCPGGALVPEPCTLKASEAGGGSEEQVPSWEARPGDWAASSFLPPCNNHKGVRWERASEVDEPPHAT